jgi:hypothetical protein
MVAILVEEFLVIYKPSITVSKTDRPQTLFWVNWIVNCTYSTSPRSLSPLWKIPSNLCNFYVYFINLYWVCRNQKVKQSRYTPWRLFGGEEYSSYLFTTSAQDGGEWSASRFCRALPLGIGPPGSHWTGGWVYPRSGLDTEVRGKILCPCRGSNLDRPVVQFLARHCTDWAISAAM